MTVASLEDIGIPKEAIAEFVESLLARGGDGEEALMVLYIKTATAAEILRKALGVDPIEVTLGDDE